MSIRFPFYSNPDLLDEAEYHLQQVLRAKFALVETGSNPGFRMYWFFQMRTHQREANIAADAHLGILQLVLWFVGHGLTPGPSRDWLLPSDN